MDNDPHRYQKFISDIAGKDIKSHNGNPEDAITEIRNWLSNNTAKEVKLPGPLKVHDHFNDFSAEFPKICAEVGIDPTAVQFKEFVVFDEE